LADKTSIDRRLATTVFCAAVVASAAQAPPPLRIAGPGYQGAIISAEAQLNSDPRHLFKPSDVWTPTEAIVREAEARLPAYLNSPRAAAALRGSRIRSELAHYKRQYWGLIRNRHREILIHFYHEDSSVVQKGSWVQGMVTVAGGGEHFFRITYQVESQRFTELQVNAPE
jgi:hypothetical protein